MTTDHRLRPTRALARARLSFVSLDGERPSQMIHGRAGTNHIVAQPPFDPTEPRQRLRVSRTRVWIGVVLLISGFAIGSSSSLLPVAKLWLGVIGLLLIVSGFFVLGPHRLRARGRPPRKLYGDERI